VIALYSGNLNQMKEFHLSADQQSHLWNLIPSPTEKAILGKYHYPETSFQWDQH